MRYLFRYFNLKNFKTVKLSLNIEHLSKETFLIDCKIVNRVVKACNNI